MHLFDFGAGPLIALLAFGAFLFGMTSGILAGKDFWVSVREAPLGTAAIEFADKLGDVYLAYDAMLERHPEVMGKIKGYKLLQKFMKELDAEIDDQKAIALLNDLRLDGDIHKQRVNGGLPRKTLRIVDAIAKEVS